MDNIKEHKCLVNETLTTAIEVDGASKPFVTFKVKTGSDKTVCWFMMDDEQVKGLVEDLQKKYEEIKD